jgi:hypothetical protein
VTKGLPANFKRQKKPRFTEPVPTFASNQVKLNETSALIQTFTPKQAGKNNKPTPLKVRIHLVH